MQQRFLTQVWPPTLFEVSTQKKPWSLYCHVVETLMFSWVTNTHIHRSSVLWYFNSNIHTSIELFKSNKIIFQQLCHHSSLSLLPSTFLSSPCVVFWYLTSTSVACLSKVMNIMNVFAGKCELLQLLDNYSHKKHKTNAVFITSFESSIAQKICVVAISVFLSHYRILKAKRQQTISINNCN